MTFDELKQAILNNTKKAEICPDYQTALLATDYPSLIAAGIDLLIWCYQNNIVTDDLITEFPEADLNAAGIYSTGTIELDDPDKDIYVIKDATLTINLSGNSSRKIWGMGSSVLALNMADNSYAEVKTYNSHNATHSINGNASHILTATDQSVNNVTAQDSAVTHIFANGLSDVAYTGKDTSHANLKALVKSTITVDSVDSSATIDTSSSGNATITLPEPPGDCGINVVNLTANVYSSSATIAWNHNPDVQVYKNIIKWRLSGTTDWANSDIINNPPHNPTYLLINLQYTTNYDVSVSVVCPDGSITGETTITFTSDSFRIKTIS